jgi:hypothetical protein
MQLFDGAFVETAPKSRNYKGLGDPLADFKQETVLVNSHTNSSSNMPRTSRELRSSNATSSKGDGDGSFYEMELEGGCVKNATATGLGSIGEDSGCSAPLGPCDGGRQAWLFFGSAFMIEALLWGMFFEISLICCSLVSRLGILVFIQ